MKKMIAVLLTLTMLAAFAACGGKEDGTTSTTTTKPGETVASTEKGTQVEYVTDAAGKTVTDAAGNPVTTQTEKKPDTETTKAGKTETTTEKEKALDVGDAVVKSEIPEDAYLSKYVKNVLSGDRYTCTITAKEDGKLTKVALTKDGDNYAADAVMEGTTAKIIYKDGKTVFCIPASALREMLSGTDADAQTGDQTYDQFMSMLKTKSTKGFYFVLDEESGMEGYDDIVNVLDMFGEEGMTFVGRSNATKDGKKYVCEEYKSDTMTIKYYFDGQDLRFVESTDASGATSTIEISGLSEKIDKSVFEIPKGYLDMTSLFSLV